MLEKDDIELVDQYIRWPGHGKVVPAWKRIKKFIEEAQNTSTNSAIMKLLNDVRLLLLDVDIPTREQRSDIVHRIAQLS